MTCLVKLEQVSRRPARGRPLSLDHVDWEIARGARVGLIGQNGAGKTTLARILAGLERPDEGRVLIDGQDLWAGGSSSGASARRGVQLVLQSPAAAVHPRLTVDEALRETARVHLHGERADVIAERIQASLEAFGLGPRARGLAGGLSGGELRRLGLARALLARPRLLILDEPTAGLDVALKAVLARRILEACPPSTTVVWISHDLEVLRCTCDRVAVLHEGRLVDEQDTAALRSGGPMHDVTRRLIDAWETVAVWPLWSASGPFTALRADGPREALEA